MEAELLACWIGFKVSWSFLIMYRPFCVAHQWPQVPSTFQRWADFMILIGGGIRRQKCYIKMLFLHWVIFIYDIRRFLKYLFNPLIVLVLSVNWVEANGKRPCVGVIALMSPITVLGLLSFSSLPTVIHASCCILHR